MTSPSIVLLRTQSDARLLALAREGHERAFEAIVERYRRQLMRTCRRVLPEARAEDSLQQALLAAWTAIARGDEVRELRPWLHRIAHRTSLNQLRMSGYDFEELNESLRIADAPDDELERRAVMRHTLAGLAALPDRQREALLAIAVAGRSQDEVASDLGLTSGAVRQLVHRARSALRAAATAITPLPVVSWAAAAAARSEPMTSRIAELSAGAGSAGAAATLVKAGTMAVIAGTAITGPAVVERTTAHRSPARAEAHAKAAPKRSHAAAAPVREVAAKPVAQVVHRTPRPAATHRQPVRTLQAPTRSSRGSGGGSGRDDGSDDDDDRTMPTTGALPESGDRSGRHRGESDDNSTSTSGSGSGSSGPGSGDVAEPEPTAEPEYFNGGADVYSEPDMSGSGSSGGDDGHYSDDRRDGPSGSGSSGTSDGLDGSGGSGPG